MKYLTALVFSLLLLVPGPALAASPWDIQPTAAQTTTLPFEFAPLEIGSSPYQVLPDFTSISFINQMGSYALTVFSMMDKLQFLGILVVLLLAIRAVWWLYSFVTDKPVVEPINISGGLDTAADVTGEESFRDYSRATRRVARFGRNPYR